jgi:hypothetical protein
MAITNWLTTLPTYFILYFVVFVGFCSCCTRNHQIDARHGSDTLLTVSSLNLIYFGDTVYNLFSYLSHRDYIPNCPASVDPLGPVIGHLRVNSPAISNYRAHHLLE